MPSTSTDEKPAPEPRFALARVLLPRVPHLLWQSARHCLSLSPTAQHWDLKTALTIDVLRTVLSTPANPPGTVERSQRATLIATKVEADTVKWDVEYGVANEEEGEGVEEVVRRCIAELGAGEEVERVGVRNVTAEWVGYRGKSAAEEASGYEAVAATAEGERTILYLHGGAYYLCDPESHRSVVINLARTSCSKVLLIRYRLAPQSPFPAAIIDALISYLYLLYPPANTHPAIPASKIVFSGDSAGGGLSFALLQLCLWFQRTGTTLLWQGRTVTVPLPAGCATMSAWIDVPRSFGALGGRAQGSEDSCAEYDYLPTPTTVAKTVLAESEAWNAEIRKRRGQTQFYAADRLMLNPLCSPILAEEWSTQVPVWMNAGDECLRDANLYMAHRLMAAGVPVKFVKYEMMPHVFPAIMNGAAAAKHSWEDMGEFVKSVTGGGDGRYEYGAWKIHPRTFKRVEFQAGELDMGLSLEEVKRSMAMTVEEYRRIFDETNGMENKGAAPKL